MSSGNLYIVATPIGNLDDISYRAIDTLKNVDLIIAEDTRHSLKLLSHYDISRPLTSYHKFNEQSKSKNIISKLKEGQNIALISDAGTPGICDPGNIIIKECIENSISIIPIPGACAFVQSLICSGFSTNSFSFYGFLVVNKKERKKQLEQIQNSTTELIILYEAPHKLKNTLNDLYTTLGNLPICISKEITKIHETHFRTTLEDAYNYYNENLPKGEYVLIIERVLEKEKKLYNLNDIETQKIILNEYKKLKNDNLSLNEISKKLSFDYSIPKKEIYRFLTNKCQKN